MSRSPSSRMSSPKIPRLHVDRSFDPQIGNVDISGLAPERIARLWPATVLRFIASAVRQREDLFALSDRAEQAGEVDEVLGNHVNDLTLALHLAATPDHVCRENEPARRVRGAPPALAQDALRSREANDAVHRQEVGRVPQPID